MSADNDIEIYNFLQEIKKEFPDVSIRINATLELMGCDESDRMYTSEMESFSQATTDAIKQKNEKTALSHLNYMSRKLETASHKELEYIDVYYVESLMWDIKDIKVKKWGWSLIPKNLKQLYIKMWGEPNF